MTISTASLRFVLQPRRVVIVAFAIFSILALSAPARAQQKGAGVRAGVSGDPSQFYFGGHFDTGFLFDKVSFRPNLEVGVGNDITVVTPNFELAYWFKVSGHPWQVYAGGGPALVIVKYGDPFGGTHTGGGFNFLLGAAHSSGFFGEIKAGLGDSPGFKFGIGYTWK